MFWLDRNTVPTMGDYFREAGYQTYYKGKWHVSNEDIVIPGTHASLLSYDPLTGVPDQRGAALYSRANRLDGFGFSGWVGPEPQGIHPRNSGSSAATGLSGRDEVYAADVAALIEFLHTQKQQKKNDKPWLVVASFVNPHDIVLYGALSAQLPLFRFEVEDVPDISPPPTKNEPLLTKPRGQHQVNVLGEPYPSVVQPNGIETVMAHLDRNGKRERWKLSRYFDSTPFRNHQTPSVPDEYELYNLTDDPLETRNLAHPFFATQQTGQIQARMLRLLEEQRKHKRLSPK